VVASLARLSSFTPPRRVDRRRHSGDTSAATPAGAFRVDRSIDASISVYDLVAASLSVPAAAFAAVRGQSMRATTPAFGTGFRPSRRPASSAKSVRNTHQKRRLC
jgi:hypothetical protein